MADADQDQGSGAAQIQAVIKRVEDGEVRVKELKQLAAAVDKQLERVEQNYHKRTVFIIENVVRLGLAILISLIVILLGVGAAIWWFAPQSSNFWSAYFILLILSAICLGGLFGSVIQVLGRLLDRH